MLFVLSSVGLVRSSVDETSVVVVKEENIALRKRYGRKGALLRASRSFVTKSVAVALSKAKGTYTLRYL